MNTIGEAIDKTFTISAGQVEADICTLGARINALRVCGVDIALGFNNFQDYLKSGTYAGATIGRVANRIESGRFILNGRTYSVTCNERGKNHLHGGIAGFDKKIFTVLSAEKCCVVLQYISEDNEEGYQGRLTLTVRFGIVDNTLCIDFAAVCDKDTLWSPTNHLYFNLDGEQSGNCLSNVLKLYADYYTPVNRMLIPTGEILPVKDTPFDFNKQRKIGADLGSAELKATSGYDHNYILRGEHAATVKSKKTGIKMDVYTDLPCVQLYSGGGIPSCAGKNGTYGQWAGFSLEPQYCPNAINMQGVEQPILKAGEHKMHYIKYKFSF
ncbi:MAG: galactose mutarotase [Clostridiales bacterium]|nr:galactose mutarotase [Clostridiales bacterium]